MMKTRPVYLWVSLLSCSFILLTSNPSIAAHTFNLVSTSQQLAQFNIRLPGIGIPSVPSVGDIFKGAIANQVTQALGSTLQTEAPIVSSAQDVFPTVDTLAGQPFRPSGDLRPLLQQIKTSSNGAILLAPGDYAIPINVFCMKHNASSPSGHRYLLAPLKGKLADVITALNSRTVGLNLPHSQLQVLSWNLQAGMKYEEMTSVRTIIDQVLPDFKPRLSRSFLEQIEATWSQLSGTIPGLPSLNASLNRLGEVGKTVAMLKQTRETLLRYGNNYESLSRSLVNSDAKASSGETPWSRLSDRVYARMVTQGNYSTPAQMQVRVLPGVGANATSSQIASGRAETVPVNLTNLVAEPQNSKIQPLSMSPQLDSKEAEDDTGSGTLQLNGEGFTGPQSPLQGLPQS